MPNPNPNYSYNSGISATLPIEQFLQRRALENVEPNLGYLNDAQFIEQPTNGGKHAKFFRYTELPPVDKPLYEGVTPDGQNLTETAFTVLTKQFGGYMSYTDELDLWHVDKKTIAISDRLNRQAKLTIDTQGRNAICAGLNVMYPGAITARSSIQATDVLTYALVKKAVRNLKRKGAQPFPDGFFHAKIDQDTYYDLSNDAMWKAKPENYDSTNLEKYLLGTIYNVKFYEVDNGMVYTAQSYLDADHNISYLTMYGSYDATNRTMTIAETMTEDVARELTGKMVYVNYSSTYNTVMCIERIYPSGTANQTKVVFRWTPDSSITNNWTTVNTTKIIPYGGGNSCDVHATIIYGQNAFGCVTLGTKGRPNIKMIVKPLGSSGSEDPLNIGRVA